MRESCKTRGVAECLTGFSSILPTTLHYIVVFRVTYTRKTPNCVITTRVIATIFQAERTFVNISKDICAKIKP